MLSDLLVQIFTRHAVYIEGVKTKTIDDFAPFLKNIKREITQELASVEDFGNLRGQRLNRLLRVISGSLENQFKDYEKVWREVLSELAEYESAFSLKALNKVAAVDLSSPAPAQIMTAAFAQPLDVKGVDSGKLLSKFYRDWTDKTKDRVTGAIRLGAAQGKTLQQLVQQIKGSKKARYKDGILDATRRDVSLIVKTSIAHITNQSRAVVYERNQDIVVGEQILAVLDSRTSEQCRGLSGRKFDVGKGPQPPLHLACRSMRLPVLDDGLDFLDGAGHQFARGAKGIERVAADMTYYEWLKTQPKGFQDDVLGATRGQLFRAGGLSAKRFSQLQLDRNFKPRSIAQMKKIEAEAFQKAFKFEAAKGPKIPKSPSKPKAVASKTPKASFKKVLNYQPRNEVEARYAEGLDKAADKIFLAAANKIKPVNVVDSEAGGWYDLVSREMSIPKDWAQAAHKHKWKGTFWHETGHAVDFFQRYDPVTGVTNARSHLLKDAIILDKKDLIAGKVKPKKMPQKARRALVKIVEDEVIADKIEAYIKEGQFVVALYVLQFKTTMLYSGDLKSPHLLSYYQTTQMNDFVGSITNNIVGQGHSDAYYKKFMSLGNGITQGHTAEAFATGFAAHVIEGSPFYTYLVNVMGPRTVKTIRKIVKDM